MNIDLLKKDYENIKDISLKIFDTDINPIRCHEMAYLFCAGLKQRGYAAEVQDGYFNNRMEHSWVKIKSGKSLVIFDRYIFIHIWFHPQSYLFSRPIYHSEFVVNTKYQRKAFKPGKIDYILAEGIDEVAEKMFLQFSTE